MKLLANVNPADQLTVDVKLRVSWPIRVFLEALAHFLVLEDIEVTVVKAVIVR